MRGKQPKNIPGSHFAARFATLSWHEFADRTRQEVQKRADAISVALGIDPSGRGFRKTTTVSPKFFFRGEDIPRLTDLLRERLPLQAEAIVEQAEKICCHRFDLLGYKDVDFGQEIDWHSDPVHGKKAPHDLWFKIRYLDFSSVGDAKMIWELNRHQHLVTLAKAYRLTNDDRFHVELIGQWRHWIKENPYGLGINWASSLEVAFRCLSWLWIYFLLEGSPAMTPEFRTEWLRAVALGGRHIENYLSTYFSPNTHLLGEALALFFIGTLCPELRSSSRWEQRGREIVLRESQRQVRPDGFYFEQSTYYHVYALDFLLHASILAARNGKPFPPEHNRGIEQMLEALAIVCRAGEASRWGDDDGGRVFDSRRNRAEHLCDPLATGAVLFARGVFKFLAGGLREETLWLLGEKGVTEFDHIEATRADINSLALADTGLYVLGSNQGRLQLIVDAGPQGALSGGHGHADALSLNLHADGRTLLGDPGTFEYVSAGTERNDFRGTAAHNTLEVDGRDQSEPQGPFGWRRFACAKAETWISGHSFDLFVGSHDGYAQLENPVLHRRWIFFRKEEFWLIRDLALGTGRHRLDLRWHLSPDLSPSDKVESQFMSPHSDVGIALHFSEGPSWSRTVGPSAWSAVYGMKEAATVVRFTTETTLPVESATLLAPIGKSHPEVEAKAKLTHSYSSRELNAYAFANLEQEHCFIFAQEKSWRFHDWNSDAEFLYFCTVTGKLNLLVFCNGTYVKFRGEKIISTSKLAVRCEIISSGKSPRVICPEEYVLHSDEVMSKSSETGETVPLENGEADR